MASFVHAQASPVACPLLPRSRRAEPVLRAHLLQEQDHAMEASLLFVHIFAAGTALAAGFLALYAEKGKWIHRRFGRAFAYAMMTMTVTAAIMALAYRTNRVNVVAATITFYLVATGLLAVIRRVSDSRRLHAWLLALGAAGTLRAWALGLMALGQPRHVLDQIPAVGIFMFAIVGTLGVIGDVRVLRAGAIEGVARLRRHLWRMNYAMWIATTSFFFGQARHLPEWMRSSNLNDYIVFAVFATLVYWLVKLRPRRRALDARRATVPQGARL